MHQLDILAEELADALFDTPTIRERIRNRIKNIKNFFMYLRARVLMKLLNYE